MADADATINFDDLVASRNRFGGDASNGNSAGSFGSPASAGAAAAAAPFARRPGAQGTLDDFLNDRGGAAADDGKTFETRKRDVQLRGMAEFASQGVVDDFKLLARDITTADDGAPPDITVAGVRRQKAGLELARQQAAERTEAQTIASNYMTQRSNVLGGGSLAGGVRGATGGGVNVPLETASEYHEGSFVIASESGAGGGGGGGGGGGAPPAARGAWAGGGSNRSGSASVTPLPGAESLADMISAMERRLE